MTAEAASIAALLSAIAEVPARMAAIERGQEKLAADLARIAAAMPPMLAAAPEAAKAVGVSEPTMRRWIKKGLVPTVKIENTVRVDLARLAGVDAERVAQLAADARRP